MEDTIQKKEIKDTKGWFSVASEPWRAPVIFFLTTCGRRLPPPERRLDVFLLSAARFYVALQLGTLTQPAAAKPTNA